MSSRSTFRLIQFGAILLRSPRLLFKRKHKPGNPKRILIIHQLLLGDALMVTSLLARLRVRYPNAKIDVAGPPMLASLYQSRPYGVHFIPFTPKSWQSLFALFKRPTYDLALPILDNRYSWTAFAIGSRWIKGYENDKKNYKDIPFNELIPLPKDPTSITDIIGQLTETKEELLYDPEQWPQPDFSNFSLPELPYVVIHLGASTPLKYWNTDYWLRLARELDAKGFMPIWSAGPNELELVKAADPDGEFSSTAGQLNLAQLWHLIQHAKLLVCPDTGITHIAKHTFTPTVCLFGPGNKEMAGYSNFFSTAPFTAIDQNIECRNQHIFFKRQVDWVQHCKRSIQTCPNKAACMTNISYNTVFNACLNALKTENKQKREH